MYHIVCFDLINRYTLFAYIGGIDLVTAEREFTADLVDILIYIGESVVVMNSTFEFISQQGSQALPILNAFNHFQSFPDPLRRKVDIEQFSILFTCIGFISIS